MRIFSVLCRECNLFAPSTADIPLPAFPPSRPLFQVAFSGLYETHVDGISAVAIEDLGVFFSYRNSGNPSSFE